MCASDAGEGLTGRDEQTSGSDERVGVVGGQGILVLVMVSNVG